jgi:molybdopterin converting factor small subunit
LGVACSGSSVVVMRVGGLLDPVKETSEVYFLPAIGGGL